MQQLLLLDAAAAARIMRTIRSTVACTHGLGMNWNMALGLIGVLRSSSTVGSGAGGQERSDDRGLVRVERAVRGWFMHIWFAN